VSFAGVQSRDGVLGVEWPHTSGDAAMSFADVTTVAIIGAGVAGLATARVLLAEGLRCQIFERRPEVGGVWAIGYSNFGVQTQKELYEFPDWPLPADTPNFTPGPIFREYLKAYANEFGITPHIRFNAPVVGLVQRTAPPGWVVSYRDDAEQRSQEFDLVAVCTGLYSQTPHIPKFPGQERFGGRIVHSSEVQTREILRGRRVVVVGFGKSATDLAVEAAAVAARTVLVVREPRWPIPQKLAGVLPFKWGLLQRLTSTLLPLYQRPSGLERIVHSIGAPLVWLYWRLVEALLVVQCSLDSRFGSRTSLIPRTRIEFDAFCESLMAPRPEFYRLIRLGTIEAHRTEIAEFTPTGMVLRDGVRIDADLVVAGTGWATDYSFLPHDVCAALDLQDDGLYLYRHMLHPAVPQLVFVGANASTFSNTTTYSLQARWLAELVQGRHALPPGDVMVRDIEQMKAWKRSWMPFGPARGARLHAHQLHYWDELLRDVGAGVTRKRGFWAPLKELLDPYEPNDYRSIVSGEWRQSAS
jgi:cation diffusion facilitator CzcD-associated flavoprotein CzcO